MPIEALDASGDDDGGWNLEGSGLCSVNLFSASLALWSIAQDRVTTVNEAALAFNVKPELIRQAVESDYWMHLVADQIEHDGE